MFAAELEGILIELHTIETLGRCTLDDQDPDTTKFKVQNGKPKESQEECLLGTAYKYFESWFAEETLKEILSAKWSWP